jgi:hypothetical protein
MEGARGKFMGQMAVFGTNGKANTLFRLTFWGKWQTGYNG